MILSLLLIFISLLICKNVWISDGTPKPHQGVDLWAEIGTPIRAVKYGEIVEILNKDDYGKQIILKFIHENDIYYAYYAHLSEIIVKKGDEVIAGTIIGYTGDTGNAKGMSKIAQHLHFEIRTRLNLGRGLDGRIDPLLFFNTKMEVK